MDRYPREDVEATDMFAPFFRRRRTWLVLVGFGLLALCGWWLPLPMEDHAISGLSPAQVRIGLGIFTCIAFLWLTEAMPLAATALLVPLLAALTGVSSLEDSLASFANPLIFVFFGGFALAAAMAYQGVDRWLAQRLVQAGRGHFLRVAVLLFASTAFLSMWMSNTATAALMLPLALGIIGRLDAAGTVPPNRIFLLLGVAYAASVGGLGTIIGSPPNGIAAKALGLGFAEWLAFGVPSVLALLPAMIGVLYLICRPSRGILIQLETEEFSFNWHRRMTLTIFSAAALCWIFGAKFAAMLGITSSWDTLVALAAVFALLYFRVVRWRDIDRGTDWGVLLLFGGGLALSEVLRDTGASLYLARLLSSGVEGWSAIWVIAAVVAFVIFLTELTSNTATAALLVPIFYSMAGEVGMDAPKLVIPLALAASCAFMLPVGTPPNALVFATGMVPQKQMMRTGLVLNLVFIVLLTALSLQLF
jgi:sodium-dependent dicarboxylate transporter 2/3/5